MKAIPAIAVKGFRVLFHLMFYFENQIICEMKMKFWVEFTFLKTQHGETITEWNCSGVRLSVVNVATKQDCAFLVNILMPASLRVQLYKMAPFLLPLNLVINIGITRLNTNNLSTKPEFGGVSMSNSHGSREYEHDSNIYVGILHVQYKLFGTILVWTHFHVAKINQ